VTNEEKVEKNDISRSNAAQRVQEGQAVGRGGDSHHVGLAYWLRDWKVTTDRRFPLSSVSGARRQWRPDQAVTLTAVGFSVLFRKEQLLPGADETVARYAQFRQWGGGMRGRRRSPCHRYSPCHR